MSSTESAAELKARIAKLEAEKAALEAAKSKVDDDPVKKHYQGLWRLSAKESVLYNDDFPEPLLVLPELWDGAIGQGKSSRIITTFRECADKTANAGMWELIVEDNGTGITNERRLKSWAASSSVDNIHRNGHGSKKALTKFMPEYESAEWKLEWRGKRNRNLQVMKSPFKGDSTDVEENVTDETTLPDGGTKWTLKFDPVVMKLNTADGSKSRNFRDIRVLIHALAEIVRTRYSETYLSCVEFQFNLEQKNGTSITKSSREAGWHSFQWYVDEGVREGYIEKLFHDEQVVDGGTRYFDYYFITAKGNTSYPLKTEFMFYGQKSMRSSRIHTALDGRMIEPIPVHRIFGREAPHNDYNGLIGFVNFMPATPGDFEKMPQPAATKVSFWPSDPRFETFLASLAPCIEEHRQRKAAQAALEAAACRAAEEARRKAERLKAKSTEELRKKAEPVKSSVTPKPAVATSKSSTTQVPKTNVLVLDTKPIVSKQSPKLVVQPTIEELVAPTEGAKSNLILDAGTVILNIPDGSYSLPNDTLYTVLNRKKTTLSESEFHDFATAFVKLVSNFI
jgi:hypothetical protein